MVIRTEASNVGSSISQLTQDIRRMMGPHTAIRLKVLMLQKYNAIN